MALVPPSVAEEAENGADAQTGTGEIGDPGADDPELLLKEYEQAVAAAAEIRSKLKAELAAALERA